MDRVYKNVCPKCHTCPVVPIGGLCYTEGLMRMTVQECVSRTGLKTEHHRIIQSLEIKVAISTYTHARMHARTTPTHPHTHTPTHPHTHTPTHVHTYTYSYTHPYRCTHQKTISYVDIVQLYHSLVFVTNRVASRQETPFS